jgi:hypothetical protein
LNQHPYRVKKTIIINKLFRFKNFKIFNLKLSTRRTIFLGVFMNEYIVIVWATDTPEKIFTSTARRANGARLDAVRKWAYNKGLTEVYSCSFDSPANAKADKIRINASYQSKGYSYIPRGNI